MNDNTTPKNRIASKKGTEYFTSERAVQEILVEKTIEECKSTPWTKIEWIKPIYESYRDSSLHKLHKNPLTTDTLFQYNPIMFLKNLKEIYIPSLESFNPSATMNNAQIILNSTYDIICNLLNNWDLIKKDVNIGPMDNLDAIRTKLKELHEKIEKYTIWSNSFSNKSEESFFGYSMSDILKNKTLLEVILDLELNPLIEHHLEDKINEELLNVELKDVIERHGIHGTTNKNLLDSLVIGLLNQDAPNIKKFCDNVNKLYEYKKEKSEKDEKLSRGNFNGFLDLYKNKYKIDSGSDVTIFKEALFDFTTLLTIIHEKIKNFNTEENPNRYIQIIDKFYSFFDNPVSFDLKINGYNELKKSRVNLSRDLNSNKIRVNGKVITYSNLLKMILNDMKQEINSDKNVEVVSV